MQTPREQTLRERKKRRTRDALLRAAVELFVSRGYEHTTVDAVAEAVDVSPRTFFRYFAGKEEAALGLAELTVERFVQAVRERPAHEPPLEALRQAVLDGWSSLHEVVETVVPVELYLRMYRVIESTPVLLAAYLRRSTEVEETLARVIAGREGLDVDADPRPRLAVAVFSGVMRMAERQWVAQAEGEFSLAGIHTVISRCLDQVGPALLGDWRKG
ncbi:TetR/AcrR family transcriptional regulator [Streptomyces sp. DSM 15324]|uniref:TetR/AcrR family transcriptional regulator n=1 Tax=Streptomyces sp. DSM 15324 TaxID=1739111 RepID=UPI0007494D62|nr:TetR family transcriptional regulator [Streptomyces sp. DSM 15324]KUO14147.1 TetR family transcriptional regulator [Streptomyces sp. DSM 15324]